MFNFVNWARTDLFNSWYFSLCVRFVRWQNHKYVYDFEESMIRF